MDLTPRLQNALQLADDANGVREWLRENDANSCIDIANSFSSSAACPIGFGDIWSHCEAWAQHQVDDAAAAWQESVNTPPPSAPAPKR